VASLTRLRLISRRIPLQDCRTSVASLRRNPISPFRNNHLPIVPVCSCRSCYQSRLHADRRDRAGRSSHQAFPDTRPHRRSNQRCTATNRCAPASISSSLPLSAQTARSGPGHRTEHLAAESIGRPSEPLGIRENGRATGAGEQRGAIERPIGSPHRHLFKGIAPADPASERHDCIFIQFTTKRKAGRPPKRCPASRIGMQGEGRATRHPLDEADCGKFNATCRHARYAKHPPVRHRSSRPCRPTT
jgi:hypothetical protein